ncbi:MAG: hypothetical protein IT430_20565 [Phycisphaerales bacterium]|nr:hypothetical protein [Phycisphaerales bacterium]
MTASGLAHIPTAELQQELERRNAKAAELQVEWVRLIGKLKDVKAEMESLGVTPPPPDVASALASNSRTFGKTTAARTRAANKMTLDATLHGVLSGTTLGITEATEAVQKAGYRSGSANLNTMVNLTLLKRKDLFKRVEHGRYTAK